ncbi:unnamed protein product [Peniophora sp. CBMAI 1063]|nr:unnamed protein product [Peniophora sp. CBMAI 1063]
MLPKQQLPVFEGLQPLTRGLMGCMSVDLAILARSIIAPHSLRPMTETRVNENQHNSSPGSFHQRSVRARKTPYR